MTGGTSLVSELWKLKFKAKVLAKLAPLDCLSSWLGNEPLWSWGHLLPMSSRFSPLHMPGSVSKWPFNENPIYNGIETTLKSSFESGVGGARL